MIKKNTHRKNRARLNDVYRITDANLNRCKEGLRVCEDICRFRLNDPSLSKKFGMMRHALARLTCARTLKTRMLFLGRDTSSDIAKTFSLGPRRKTFKDVFMANAQRVKEGLRVLEELLKLIDEKTSNAARKLRFAFYDLEKESIKRFPALLDP